MTSSEKWYADGLRFECLPDCHACCLRQGIVELCSTEQHCEIHAMAHYLAMPEPEFRKEFVRFNKTDGHHLNEAGTRTGCPLWRDGCTVYPARPRQCSNYPFWPELVASRRAWNKEALSCPGMNTGRLWSAEEIDAIASRP